MNKAGIFYKHDPEDLLDFKIKVIVVLRISELWFTSYLERPKKVLPKFHCQ